MKAIRLVLVAAIAATFAVATAQAKPLYERLGGVHGIAALVDDFVDHLLKDQTVGSNPKVVESLGKLTPAGIKFQVTCFLSDKAGGPQKYAGQSMKDAHASLGISPAEWEAAGKVFVESMARLKVGEKEQSELLALIQSLHGDIVENSAQKPSPAVPEHPDALYYRLGGIQAIAAVTDTFVNRLLSNPTVQANKNATAKPGTTVAGLKYLVAELLGQVTGGPQKYTGRDMKASHDGMAITSGEWDAMVSELVATFDEFKVPSRERAELVAILATTKNDIVKGG